MSGKAKLIPTSSQTVGPYFCIGLEYLVDCTPSTQAHPAKLVTIRGRVLDRDGAPVSDALLEFWSPAAGEHDASANSRPAGLADGFKRAATDPDGNFFITMLRPAPVPVGDGRMQAPHLLVLLFARGLLRNLITRVYFDDEQANQSDPVLLTIPAERRRTLIAQSDGEGSFCWDVQLQGAGETVFFAW